MKRLKIIIPLLIIILIPIRLVIINNYKIVDDLDKLIKIKKGLVISDLKVVHEKEVENYIEYNNIKISKNFENIECNDKNNTNICTFDDKIITMSQIDSIISEYETYSNNKIDTSDDLQFLGLIKTSYNNPSFFTPIKKTRLEYTYNMFALNYFKVIKSIDLIEGDIKGLLFYENDNEREFYLYKDNKTYKITFKNIDDNTIIDLISTIKID
ncbi:MAG: hypothetical protein Q4E69_06535 [Bacilli bacterium]|nr:hypothetical protein [Bacilli bacterium]